MCTRYWRKSLAVLAALSLTSISGITSATDFRLTGFGTVGYARSSERDVTYLRYIDHNGTFKADSLVGVQAEAQFNSQWGVTVQAVASAPRTEDHGYEAKIRWAFVSFRPDNDWLLRVGRIRPPFFFNTQNAEVGVTYDQARLPVEVYGISPIYDFDGASANKSWTLGATELNVEGFWGKSDAALRGYSRDLHQPIYESTDVRAKGLVATVTSGQLAVRGGIHHATATLSHSGLLPGTLAPMTPFSPAPEPFGGVLYVPDNFFSETRLTFFTLGVDWNFGASRVTAEYVQSENSVTNMNFDGKGAYVTFAHKIGNWTPNMTYARRLSDSGSRRIYDAVNSTSVPLLAQGPPLFLASNYHRALVDQTMLIYDQYSTSLGTSYAFSPTSKLKMELARTQVRLASSFFDGEFQNKSNTVFSISYSVAY